MQDDFTTYIIPGHRIEDAHHRIEKANNRLRRAGITEQFTYTETPENQIVDGQEREAYRLEISTPSISYQGWTFAAAVDILDNGTVLRSPSDINADDLPRPDTHNCDHCGVSRGRKYSYLLKNENTGEIKQIGKSCLTLFLGVSPSGLWSLQWDDLSDLEADTDDHETWSLTQPVFPVDDVVRITMAVSDNGQKFVSQSRAEDTGDTPTSHIVAQILNPFFKGGITDEQRRTIMEKAADISQDDINKVFRSAENIIGNYGDNLRAVIGNDHITGKHLGLLCSIVSAYRRDMAYQEKKRIQEQAPDSHLGDVGEKISGIPVTVLNKISFDGNWGVQNMLIMRSDDTGHILKWTSGSVPSEINGVKVDIGSNLIIDRATVKKHTDYRGIAQTEIIRVKLVAQEKEKEA